MSQTSNLITVTHARENFSLIVNRTVFGHENYIIQRNGKKLAVLLSFEEYQLIRTVLARSLPDSKTP
jgi:prevent-host-death family protein